MTALKIAPGPWAVENPMGADNGLWIVQAGLPTYEWDCIAIVTKSDPDEAHERTFITAKHQQAHAKLIAAAPTMYEALQKIALGDGLYGLQAYEYKQIARAALAALEGGAV